MFKGLWFYTDRLLPHLDNKTAVLSSIARNGKILLNKQIFCWGYFSACLNTVENISDLLNGVYQAFLKTKTLFYIAIDLFLALVT